MERIKQLAHFGGFSDLEYLKRTLSQEFQQMEAWYIFSLFFSLLDLCIIFVRIFYVVVMTVKDPDCM